MQFSGLVERIRGDGADAWDTHYAASAAHDRGEDVIVLSIGDPPIDTPTPVVERAIERLNGIARGSGTRARRTHAPGCERR